MQAIVLEEFGGPDKLLYKTDYPDPATGDDEVLIATAAASLNPLDWKVRESAPLAGMMGLSLPAVLGLDISGVVRSVGRNVSGVAPGDRVFARINWKGYASLVSLPATDIAHIPDGLDTVEAAALPLVALTGDQLIREACALQSGQTVLITGATGPVGRCAVHSALTLGARVVAGVRKKHLEDAEALGAERVVLLDDDDAIDKLDQYDAIADGVGGSTATRLLAHVKTGGVFGSLLGPVQGSTSYPNIRVSQMFARNDPSRLEVFAEDLAAKRFALPIAARFPLAKANEAHAYAEKGVPGKVLLVL